MGGFLRLVPYREGLSLDTMRRAQDTPNGLNEALVVAVLEHAREELGVRQVSLNFAGFSHVVVPSGSLTPRQRVLRVALRLFHGRFQLERLVRFNDKFGPTWRRRYLVYGGTLELPRAGVRVLQAEAYIRPPPARPMPARWQPSGARLSNAHPARTP